MFGIIYRRLLTILITRKDKRMPCRTIWCKPRSKHWWMSVQNDDFGVNWWKENLRMNKTTFSILCNELRPFIQKKTTILRDPISVEQRVAVTLWKLTTNVEYRTISNLFGIGLSTVGSIVIETCQVISNHLLQKYVYIPKGNLLKDIIEGFSTCWGFPQAAGAVDGSHVPIIRPQESASDYYNRKGFYSVIIQGLVDYRGQFMDVYIGWPGKVHDARVFVNSSVYTKGSNGTLLPSWTRKLCSVDVPLVILGDPAYPLLPWLMKPYIENDTTTAAQKLFNYRQSRARMVVENAFGRLKGRWRCLLKRLDTKLENVTMVIAACVVLHNVCEKYGDSFCEEWTTNSSDLNITSSSSGGNNTAISPLAVEVRNAIKDYLSNQ